MSQTFAPTATYGSNAVKNRVKIGGALGSNQYFYKTNAKTGTVEINRYDVNNKTGKVTETKIGKIPQGGKFIPNSDASSAEKSHYSSPRAVGKVRAQALQVAQREWDGKTQPPPTQAIYGTNSGNSIGFTPPGSSTADESLKGIQNLGSEYSVARSDAWAQNAIAGGIGAALSGDNIAEGIVGGILGNKGSATRSVTVYPVTLRRSGNAQDWIEIDMLEWKAKQKQGMTWGARDPMGERKALKTIILPIPGGISDSNSVSWGDDKMDPTQTAMANLALTGIEQGGGALAKEVEGLGKQIKEGKSDVKDAISKGIAGMASGTGAQLLTRTTGQIMNPNMELLFRNPSLRPFSFTWKLAARNRSEADAIIKIINIFKKGMAPQTSESNIFLKSPHTWRLRYKHKGRTHKYLNKFKECAMTSFTTQYTPDGNYATFESGHMTAYSITMGLQELEPVFSSDYSNDNEIGY